MTAAPSLTSIARNGLRRYADHHPNLFRLTYRLAGRPTEILVNRDSDLLIEGFPRSANTYAAWAFMLANPRGRLARHVHSAAHVMLALRYRVPALVLLRSPQAAIESLLVRRPSLHPKQAVIDYFSFYSALVPYKNDIIVGSFATVTENFAKVIAAVNSNYGTDFQACAADDKAGQARIFAAIDDANKGGHGGSIDTRSVPRPHPERQQMKASLHIDENMPEFRQAQTLYDRLLPIAI